MFTTAERRIRDETRDGSETSVTDEWHEYIRKKWIILYAVCLYSISLSQTKFLYIFSCLSTSGITKNVSFHFPLMPHPSSLIWKGQKRFVIPAKHTSRFSTHLLSTFRLYNSHYIIVVGLHTGPLDRRKPFGPWTRNDRWTHAIKFFCQTALHSQSGHAARVV